jgi:hypothetical protein
LGERLGSASGDGDGDAREAVKALIVANHFLVLKKLRAAVSPGYERGQLLPRYRKDWYD